MNNTDYVFGADGPLASAVTAYRRRPEQQAMASAVSNSLANRESLLVEAGTGVGKTFAYLVPALLSGQRVVISTGTRSLQDQLFSRDLPVVSAAIGRPADVCLLKGRRNYLCRHRLNMAAEEARFPSREEARWFTRIKQWALAPGDGDIAGVEGVPEDARVWSQVTSTSDNCLGSRCPEYQGCHLVEARRRALEAEIVVVNHHLLLADMVLREEGFGELLPGADAVIVDEAHQLPETAVTFFGVSVSARQLDNICRDCVAEGLRAGASLAELEAASSELIKALNDARMALAAGSGRGGRQAWHEAQPGIDEHSHDLAEAASGLAEALQALGGQSPGMDAVIRRAENAAAGLTRIATSADDDAVRWFESFGRSFVLHMTPPDAADGLGRRIREQGGSWIFTSATLAVGNDFSHYSARLGLPEAASTKLDSPFDFRRNARLYLPRGMPEPAARGYTGAVIEAARPLIETAGGRTFLLFTSHRALREAAALLRIAGDSLAEFPLLVQGEEPREKLLERFRSSGNAILLGTSSFWEGVDVRGEALALVVIDRLPFAAPGDPLLKARLEAIRRSGGQPFRDYQLPQAVIALKQGVGRLIRDYDDRGVVMICDPRLSGRSYGRSFLASLPPMPVVRDGNAACIFLAQESGQSVGPDYSNSDHSQSELSQSDDSDSNDSDDDDEVVCA
ncbi:MAG: ATP-dependent DNA helicase [Gammaproteobacteria bacterium]